MIIRFKSGLSLFRLSDVISQIIAAGGRLTGRIKNTMAGLNVTLEIVATK